MLAIAAIVGGVVLYLRRDTREPPIDAAVGVASGTASTTRSTTAVRRLSTEDRKKLGEQIRAAIQRARSSPAAPSTTQTTDNPRDLALETIGQAAQEMLRAAIPLLAECYGKREDGLRAAARLTMITDPDLGTVIDTDAVTGGDGKPLASALETCLRDVIDSLELPPLGRQAGRVKLEYTFRFDP